MKLKKKSSKTFKDKSEEKFIFSLFYYFIAIVKIQIFLVYVNFDDINNLGF